MAQATAAFIAGLPKVELHVHIQGVLDAPLRHKLAQKNNVPDIADTVEGLERRYQEFFSACCDRSTDVAELSRGFFELFERGGRVLVTADDFYELAMLYYRRAAQMNVRYAEPFIDFMELTRWGVSLDTQMAGYRRAQVEAKRTLGVKSAWVLSFSRTADPIEMMAAYEDALRHRDMIVGIGMAGFSDESSPLKFNQLYTRARQDGFRLTIHCDPTVPAPAIHQHIRECVTQLGGGGVDRIDHGISAADSTGLVDLLRRNAIGLTICPWTSLPALMHHDDPDQAFFEGVVRRLFDSGVRISIHSDDPALAGQNWVQEALEVVADRAKFTQEEVVQLSLNAVEMSWASCEAKAMLREEIVAYQASPA
ncbi:adenosine deaminase 2 [Aspergillus japonicus CBS 114.51]|uniref:Adenosine deaminase 2 n=1 Tax=Aspergillus japonicus CBS 114.51 TaxID=1448312 RepID=A0A8T8WX65_ASPJA|nr:adenosine deaminase 2 [Aspergillus japonicus CBS 114.51]RAH80465.1 adenosine deaminase 2 [Aspergillus japonicus CBS 114.51]